MARKTILIPGWSMGPNSFGVTLPYMEFFSSFGNVIVAPPTKDIFPNVDLVVLPGGKDTLSSRYGEVPSFYNSDPDLYKEFFLENNLPEYIKAEVPIFGICLGMQMLQVHFGGKLVQNCLHPYSSDKNRGELVHKVEFTKPFMYLKSGLHPRGDYKVNSIHHQGVHIDELADDLEPIMLGEDKTTVEALQHKELPIIGVQYHPEEIYDEVSMYLISGLLEDTEEEKTKSNTKKEILS